MPWRAIPPHSHPCAYNLAPPEHRQPFRLMCCRGTNKGLFDKGERREQDTKNVTYSQLGRRPLVTLC